VEEAETYTPGKNTQHTHRSVVYMLFAGFLARGNETPKIKCKTPINLQGAE
jgi:hypothetical protein